MKTWLPILLFCAVAASAAELPSFTAGKSTVSFTALPKQAEPDEVKWRLHSVEQPGAFDLAKEKFQLIVPATYQHTEKWGVFIWISPGDTAAIPADWEPVLAARKLLFVGALKSGNPRNIFDRVRLAVAANLAMRERFNVDGRRVYVSGHSGGGRVATVPWPALAEQLDSPGELAILAARAEGNGNHQVSLQIGKTAFSRGIDAAALAYPLGVIPASANIAGSGKCFSN